MNEIEWIKKKKAEKCPRKKMKELFEEEFNQCFDTYWEKAHKAAEEPKEETGIVMDKPAIWRKEVRDLSNEDLIDELNRPTSDWEKDVRREALARLLKR